MESHWRKLAVDWDHGFRKDAQELESVSHLVLTGQYVVSGFQILFDIFWTVFSQLVQPRLNPQALEEALLSDWTVANCVLAAARFNILEVHVRGQIGSSWIRKRIVKLVMSETPE